MTICDHARAGQIRHELETSAALDTLAFASPHGGRDIAAVDGGDIAGGFQLQRLMQLGCDDVDTQTLSRARRLFTAALETPGGLKIQTIHAFCERILQLFPVEAGVAPGFEVLESRQTAQLLRDSRGEILFEAQSETNSLLTSVFTTVARYTQADNFDGLLDVAHRNK
jgi:ATP-dependent exoDNAse (exonuclease V) beta subunit